MRARRALLYIPGNDLHKIEKGAGLDVDCVVMDLEDAVSLNSKQEAREITAAALRSLDFGKSERLVRINTLYSELSEKDLDMIIPGRPDAILLSKTTQASDVTKLSEILLKYEQDAGWQEGSIKIFGVVETALGIINLKDICQSDPRLEVIICGGEDLAADLMPFAPVLLQSCSMPAALSFCMQRLFTCRLLIWLMQILPIPISSMTRRGRVWRWAFPESRLSIPTRLKLFSGRLLRTRKRLNMHSR